MAYKSFRIVEGVKRVSLKIPAQLGGTPETYILNKEYPMEVEDEIVLNPYIGYPGKAIDSFKYQIKPNDSAVAITSSTKRILYADFSIFL